MKCPECKIIEMKVKSQTETDITWICPNCSTTEKQSVEDLMSEIEDSSKEN